MVRILHIVPNMNMGGLETFIMNIYENIDREKIQFDFLEHYKEESAYDKRIEELGGKIYHFSFRNDKRIIKYIVSLNKFFRKHKEYKVIHCHMESVGSLVFFIAKLHGIKVRIGHSHTTSANNDLKGFIKKIISKPFKYFTTINLACSTEAGKYLFGKKKFTVIPNAINMDVFKYNLEFRNNLRKEFNISDEKLVIGHVGRMDKGKNQLFLIDIFNNYIKVNKNALLVLVGAGEDKEKIINKIDEYKISDKVILTGIRRDVNKIYSMFDMFIFPSLFEGLPLTLIEAEVNGLNILASSSISKECVISNKIKFLNVFDTADKWANEIVNSDRKVLFNENKEKYDIKNTIKYLESKYIYLNK